MAIFGGKTMVLTNLRDQSPFILDDLRRIRNEVVHGMVDYKTVVDRKVIQRLERITEKYQQMLDSSPMPADT